MAPYFKKKILLASQSPRRQQLIADSGFELEIIKIDVEGYELEVLQGINSENFKKIKNIFIEIENYRENYTNQIIDILTQNNFDYKIIGKLDLDWIDIIATNKNN